MSMATIQFSSDFNASHCPQKFILNSHTSHNKGSDFWFLQYGRHIHNTTKNPNSKIFNCPTNSAVHNESRIINGAKVYSTRK